MATSAIILFGKKHARLFSEPILEIGSKIQSSYKQHSPREIHSLDSLSEGKYIGIDIEQGEGVDVVIDLCDSSSVKQLGEERFNTVHCHCVLEHVPNVFDLCRNIEKIIRPGGKLFVSVPFAWKIHRIPYDMWRFTPQSIDYLFPRLNFKLENCAISTRHPEQILPMEVFPELPLGTELKTKGFFFEFAIRTLRKLKLDNGYFSNRALLIESNLMMIGEKVKEPIYTFFRQRQGSTPERE